MTKLAPAGASPYIAVVLALLVAATISGVVVNDEGTPLRNIDVQLIEVSLTSCCVDQSFVTGANGAFAFDAPASVYALRANAPTPYYPALARIDFRSGAPPPQTLVLTRTPRRYLPDDPPRAANITVSTPDAHHMATVRGEVGAVVPNGVVVLHTLDVGALKFVESAADGSFTATTFAPAGSSIQVKHDPYGEVAKRSMQYHAYKQGDPQSSGILFPSRSDDHIFLGVGGMAAMTGTIVHVPLADPGGGKIPFGGAGSGETGTTNPPHFVVRGTIDKLTFARGETIDVDVAFTIDSPVLATYAQDILADAVLVIERINFADGRPNFPRPMEASSTLTPTGLAIESAQEGSDLRTEKVQRFTAARTSSTHAEASIKIAFPVAADLPSGYYRPYVRFFFRNGWLPFDPQPAYSTTTNEHHHDRLNAVSLPVIRIGDPAPPRLFATLFSDGVYSGTRGAVALEDADCCNLASVIQSPSKALVVPRIDERSGALVRYRIEPHLIMVSAGDRGIAPNPPMIRFKFPSGSLTARIEHADGTVETIGPAPFVQGRSNGPLDRHGRQPDPGGRTLHDSYQLTTFDPRFEIAFRSEGPHRIHIDASIDDEFGRTWRATGTYVVQVGRNLTLDTATLPGTPFEAGDDLTPAVTIRPPLPADVAVRVQLYHQTTRVLDATRHTLANRFGTATAPPIAMPQPGEYRVDVEASYRDELGRWWFGSRSWGGVVATPNTPIVARGIRGIDGVPTHTQPVWFFRNQTPAQPIPSSHVNLPFESGDVAWLQERDALIPLIAAQDTAGAIQQLFTSRMPNPTYAERAAAGEMDLFSSAPDSTDVYTEPEKVDVWGYAYRSIQRPAVRIREQIAFFDRFIPSMYWRFSEFYGFQAGVGRNGDRPNDFKFQFGGTVIRGSRFSQPHYAIYGSLFVLVPEDDSGGGTRTFPPFQGNGGGPSGGPLFTLKGQEIDLFFHPTGVRSGTILNKGQVVSFAGYAAPTLPSKIDIVVTSPGGAQRTISGRANRVGYFHEPSFDFIATETGVWRARIVITFNGRTSAGPVAAPFPSGGILGAEELTFYVIDAQEPPLPFADAPSRFVRPADAPLHFAFVPPVALSDVALHYTVSMPGWVLDEGRKTSLTYDYDARALAVQYPNLDLEDSEGAAGADSITLSFVVSGNDASGTRRYFARQVVLEGEEVQNTAQARVVRRRAVR